MSRQLLPQPVKRWLRSAHRTLVMRTAMRRVLKDPIAAVNDHACLSALVYGWGNEGWSAESEYLRHMVTMMAKLKDQQVLECGSGLSTLLLSAAAKKFGCHVVSLENDSGWARRVQVELARFGLQGASTLLVAPLRSFGAFSWYGVKDSLGPFAGVICDGPPSTTRGGRYGLVQVMKARLAPGCRILLDDVAREDERRILTQWSAELGANYSILGTVKLFAELTVPDVR